MSRDVKSVFGQHHERLGMTRRSFLGAAAGAAATATGAFAERASAAEVVGDIRILLASLLAQSALLMLAPETLAGLVEPVPEAELPYGDAAYNDLPLVGGFNAYSPESYRKTLEDIRPELVIDARVYTEDHWSALEELSSAFPEIEIVPLDVSGLTVFGAVKAVMDQVPKKTEADKLDALEWLESELAVAVEAFGSGSRPAVHMGEDSRSTCQSSRFSAERLMLAEAGADWWAAKSEDSMYNGDGPEVVVVSSMRAWKGYLGKSYAQFCWTLTDAAACGDVLPGLVAGTQWVQDMSGFAKASVGAFWLGGLLHPEEFGDRLQGAVERYYSVLCGNPSTIGAVTDRSLDVIQESFAGKTRMQRLELQREHAALRAKSAEEAFARVEEEARRERDADSLGRDFDAFSTALGLEPDEAARERFIEAMLESYANERGK